MLLGTLASGWSSHILALESQHRPIRSILLLGDSLSASYGMRYEDGWVPRLQQKLHTEGYATEIINASTSGETTAGGAERVEALLAEHKPDVLWIELGGNDGLRGHPISRIEQSLRRILRAGQQAGSEVWLTRIRIPPNYGPRYTSAFEALFQQLGDEDSVRLVPFIIDDVVLEPALMMQDGIHPTKAAQARIVESVWKWLRSDLESRGAADRTLAR